MLCTTAPVQQLRAGESGSGAVPESRHAAHAVVDMLQ
jgi:hypothetical protein